MPALSRKWPLLLWKGATNILAFTDHTTGLKIAGGLDEQRLEKQGKETAALNRSLKKQGVTILKSAEVDLSPADEGDMKPSALKKLDVVLGCFHPSERMRIWLESQHRPTTKGGMHSPSFFSKGCLNMNWTG